MFMVTSPTKARPTPWRASSASAEGLCAWRNTPAHRPRAAVGPARALPLATVERRESCGGFLAPHLVQLKKFYRGDPSQSGAIGPRDLTDPPLGHANCLGNFTLRHLRGLKLGNEFLKVHAAESISYLLSLSTVFYFRVLLY